MGLPKKHSDRSQNGIVSFADYKNGLRLRWRYEDTWPALYISSTIAGYQKIACMIKSITERDKFINDYDESLKRYQELLHKATIHDATLEHQIILIAHTSSKTVVAIRLNQAVDFIHLFTNTWRQRVNLSRGFRSIELFFRSLI
jgi:hypothetical protein